MPLSGRAACNEHASERQLQDGFVTAETTSWLVVGNRGRPVSRPKVGVICRRAKRSAIITLRHRQQRLEFAKQSILWWVKIQRAERRWTYPYLQTPL